MSRRVAWEVAMRSLTPATVSGQFGQARIERCLFRWNVREPPAKPLGGGVEILELDKELEVRKHQEMLNVEC